MRISCQLLIIRFSREIYIFGFFLRNRWLLKPQVCSRTRVFVWPGEKWCPFSMGRHVLSFQEVAPALPSPDPLLPSPQGLMGRGHPEPAWPVLSKVPPWVCAGPVEGSEGDPRRRTCKGPLKVVIHPVFTHPHCVAQIPEFARLFPKVPLALQPLPVWLDGVAHS